jgi:hypothetical protein
LDRERRIARCYARGYERLGGRCAEHRDPTKVFASRVVCGWRRSEGAPACNNPVWQRGQRCHIHKPDHLQERDARHRRELEDRLARKLKLLGVVEYDIARLRAQLERMGPRQEQEAAE